MALTDEPASVERTAALRTVASCVCRRIRRPGHGRYIVRLHALTHDPIGIEVKAAAVGPIAIAAYPIVAAPFEHFTGFAGNRELPQQYRWFCGRQTVR
jgi:hypothetical protein